MGSSSLEVRLQFILDQFKGATSPIPRDPAEIGMVTNELEEILLHDLKNQRANQFPDPHTPDFRLHSEFTNDLLIER